MVSFEVGSLKLLNAPVKRINLNIRV
jgi:hypothetical protein